MKKLLLLLIIPLLSLGQDAIKNEERGWDMDDSWSNQWIKF